MHDYSEIEWKREWFPNMRSKSYGYWKDKQNQRKFFEGLVKILNINEPKDWGKVTVNSVHEYGGKSLLIHYQNSLYRALCSVYKGVYYLLLVDAVIDVHWKKEWFASVPVYPKVYWESEQNRKEFLDHIAAQYFIKKPQDWARVTYALVKKHGGQVSSEISS